MEKALVTALALWIAALSLLLFACMGADKRRAQCGRWRVPEKRLFVLALLGGAPGGLLGMLAFRHKTKHWYFALGFRALALLQLGALAWLAWTYVL